jgi:hypothetical protein
MTHHTRKPTGMALVIVMGSLILLSVLILAFLASVKTDLQSSKSYSDNNSTRMLAETSVNVVMAQIRQATTESGNAWASQPGMMRTYDTAGALVNAYKLYSSTNMVVNTQASLAADLGTETNRMTSWNSNPAFFTDLNEPVTTGTGSVYPILTPPSGNIDGYSVSNAPVAGGSNPVPMPAQWLYVLQDGTLVAPGGSGNTATVSGATSKNPIIGRIAFWADDETCKVNVNTAGGDAIGNGTTSNGTGTDPTAIANATFWDSPRFTAPDEMKLAQYQPASGEFQRYPGHPATIALNNVLNGLGWNLSSSNFFSLTPRYAFGGSQGGTIAANTASSIPLATSRLYSSAAELLFKSTAAGNPPVRDKSAINGNDTATQQRMESARFFLTAHSRAPELNLFGQPRISIWPVWDTAVSNPGVPTTTARTAIDQLLAFVATNGSNAYYFTRADNASSYADATLPRNQQLLGYLDYFTSSSAPLPGFGGYFQNASKYGQQGTRQILTEIFDYIRTTNVADTSNGATAYGRQWNQLSLYSGTIPDFGFAQVAPTIMGSSNSGLSNSLQAWNTQGEASYPRLTEVSLQFIALGQGALPNPGGSAAIPLNAGYTGHTNLFGPGDTGTDPADPTKTKNTLATGAPMVPPGHTAAGSIPTMAVQAVLLLNFVNPAETRVSHAGGNDNNPFLLVEVQGLGSMTLTGIANNSASPSLGFTNDDALIMGGSNASNGFGPFMGLVGFNNMLTQINGAGRVMGNGYIASPTNKYTAACTNFPFYSKIIPIQINATKEMYMSAANLTITVYDGSAHATAGGMGNPVQTYTVSIPAGTFPIPIPGNAPPVLGIGGQYLSPATSDIWSAGYLRTGPKILIRANAANPATTAPTDTVESMVLSGTWNDPRLLAVNGTISPFVTHPNWGQQMAHNLSYGAGIPYPGNFTPGKLVQGAVYLDTPASSASNHPLMGTPNGVTTSGGVLGDWDNGIANNADGPWINKADEGELYSSAASFNVPYFATTGNTSNTGPSFFSPNREVPSPGMFGSLPTGVDPTGSTPKPWQTLLFRPGPSGHPGSISPPDHLLLDLFWMPIAEPYPISEPFSSAGKVNLNYQIMPYTYITRSTGLRAVLATEKVAAVDVSQAQTYKVSAYDSTNINSKGMKNLNARLPLNLDATLAQFDTRFSNNDIFKSASQICEMYLVPQGYSSSATFAADWYGSKFALVGDNVRERPYANIYGRVTTKSNTYQVHYRVQSLQKIKSDPNQAQWVEGRDQITGEKQGATVIERYIDPNATITDFAASPNAGISLEPSYKFRIINSTSFHP